MRLFLILALLAVPAIGQRYASEVDIDLNVIGGAPDDVGFVTGIDWFEDPLLGLIMSYYNEEDELVLILIPLEEYDSIVEGLITFLGNLPNPPYTGANVTFSGGRMKSWMGGSGS